jgi:hypothetical protein
LKKLSPEEIAAELKKQGKEWTPQEVRCTIANIAAKFRALDPSLPDDDEECLDRVMGFSDKIT